MSQFRGNFTNRLDGKGRVSVPASFRPALNGSLVLRRSTRHACLEAWPTAAFATDQIQATPMDVLLPEDDELAYAMYSDTLDLSLDPEGRVLLPKEYKEFAGLSDAITFLGRPGFFELWEPVAAVAVIERARQAYAEKARTLAAARAGAPKPPVGGEGAP